MYRDCPEEPNTRAVLRGGELPRRRTAETSYDICVGDEEFAALCAKRKPARKRPHGNKKISPRDSAS